MDRRLHRSGLAEQRLASRMWLLTAALLTQVVFVFSDVVLGCATGYATR